MSATLNDLLGRCSVPCSSCAMAQRMCAPRICEHGVRIPDRTPILQTLKKANSPKRQSNKDHNNLVYGFKQTVGKYINQLCQDSSTVEHGDYYWRY
ncbi:hypothetical protein Y032_0659g1266 [Ancylostoma ceylanicum]|uniref:Uncharacterized protein n=1 Tax=Ancylostoma ceylanicum TaxID=53326 RepID=A0A016WJB5_9BILA|nr:hypothetical protein Y032_0659g1266 [Ancylostoma ceylanicum]